MIYRAYKNQMLILTFVTIVASVLVATSNHIVKSQSLGISPPSSSRFERSPAPNDFPNIILAPESAGSLDPTFGTGGKLTTDFSSNESAGAVALQADGKIVAAGSLNADVNSLGVNDFDFALFRYNEDGSLDASFDTDGKVVTPISAISDGASSVAIQADGKIVAAGWSGVGAALVRYNTDGSLDPSFGIGGKVTTSAYLNINEIAIQTDGKIVAAGSGSMANGFTTARYNSNGSLDASFGVGGIATTNFGAGYQGAYSLAVQADGKIVAAGYAGYCDEKYCYPDFALARYNTDGSLDTSFDSDGKLTTQFAGSNGSAESVVVQPDGKIVASGTAFLDYSFAVTRYNPDGALDTSFDGDGRVVTSVGAYGGYANSTALQVDGKIIVSGYAYVATGYDFALIRLNSDGSLDNSLDGDGKLTTDFGSSYDFASAVAIQTNGKIVAGGRRNPATTDVALSRYNADGSLDTAFDGDGKVTTSLLEVSSAINAVTIDQGRNYTFLVGYSGNGTNHDFAIARVNGPRKITPVGNSDDRAYAAALSPFPIDRVFVAGSSSNGSDSDFAIVRYFPFGLDIDTSLNQTGKVTTDFGGNETATAIAVQADYKFVVVGHTNGGAALAVARYNFDGSLDASFGSGGKVILQALQNAKAIAIQPDGKIIAAGSAPHTEPPFGDNFALARLNPNGSLDTSFDGDGIAVTGFGFTSRINAIALQRNGRIVASGFASTSNPGSNEFALARYNADGSLDTSFDGDGKITTPFVGVSTANAVGIQRNGKIVAVGSSTNGVFADFTLARYNPNGSLDTTFDTDGKQTTDFFGGDDIAFAASIQSDGKIIAAGSAHREGKTDFAAARYVGDRASLRSRFDFDGDGRADVSVFRPSDRVWYLNQSTNGFSATQFGLSTDKITPADYDGDGKTDISVYRDGTWYWLNSSDNSFNAVQFGIASDIPVPADYDGDGGVSELAVYRNGTWWILNLSTNQVSTIQFGLVTDKPVVGDYDGDGRADQAIYRNGEWHLNRSTQGYWVFQWGLATDKPVPEDYDGDGKTDLAVYRDGTWYLMQSLQGWRDFQWGISSDIPAPADYDGDGKADAAVYRAGTWYLRRSSSVTSVQQFGVTGDQPLASAYVSQ